MVTRRISSIIWEYYSNSRYRRSVKFVFLVALGVLWFTFQTMLGFFPTEATIVILLLAILVSTEALETETHRIGNWVLDRVMVLERHNDLADETDIVEIEPGDDVFVLGYDGSSSLLRKVADGVDDGNGRLFLLYQHPAHTYENFARKPVVSTLQFLYMHTSAEDVRIRFYREPASLMGIKTAQGVSAGWYTYLKRRQETEGRPVAGPRHPSIVASTTDERNYRVLEDFFDDVYRNLYRNGQTVSGLCESDDCPDGLREWLESGSENQRKRRQEWVETVSGRNEELPL